MIILGIAGAKRSGKDSSAKYIVGTVLKNVDVIEKFEVTDDGRFLVNAAQRNEDGKIEEFMGEFDLDRLDDGFIYYLSEKVWPHVRIYHFADMLKFILMNLYGIEYNSLYGTSEEREAESSVPWKELAKILPKSVKPSKIPDRNVTNRELMQYVADVLRVIDDDCFIKSTLQRILTDQTPFSIIADVRTVAEVEAIKAAGGKVIYHTRRPNEDAHSTENGFADVNIHELFDFVMDNRACTMTEKNNIIVNKLREWNWL